MAELSITQQFEKFKSHFCDVLKLLCRESGSINKVCKDLGINRQQFSKYISGANMPSPFVIQKLSDYFKISPSVFFLSSSTDNITEFLSESKISLKKIVGYYLEYSLIESSDNVFVSVSAWRIYTRGAVVIAHGEVPYVEPSTGQKWFSSYSGTVNETNRQIMITASNGGGEETANASALWLLRPYSFGMSDLMAIRTLSEHGPSRPMTTTVSYFRSVGSYPDLARLVLEECGIFERKALAGRASAILDIIDASRSLSSTQLRLLGT